jgi:hypothetical protein
MRNCIWGLAAIFRQFTFELYKADVTDVLLAHDYLLPCPKLDSKGVRVKVAAGWAMKL